LAEISDEMGKNGYSPDSRIQAVTDWPMRWVKARLKVL
jgi:hypothetical protein